MGRTPCCEKNNGLKKGPWTPEEDQKLLGYIQKHGHGSWRTLPKNAGLARCGKSCRLRWTNYLRPDIKRGRFSFEEEETIIQLHSIMGNKWSAIAARLPGRTDNEIKNYWNTHIRKRLLRMGIDPVTHTRRLDLLDLSTLLTNPLTMYDNSAQFDVSQLLNNIEPLINSEFLRVASNLLSPQCHQGFNSFQQVVPICTTSNSDAQLLSQLQTVMQPNIVGPFHHDEQPNLWQDGGLKCNLSENFGPLGRPTIMDDSSNLYWADNRVQNFGLITSAGCNSGSGLTTTPVSSPTQLNSGNSTYITSSIGDERDSNCSENLKFGIPDLLDVGDFL